MFGKFPEIWSDIKNGLWFIPTLMGIGATILAFLFIELDTNINYKDLPFDWFLYAGNREGARSVLSTIASSMATIAGVTFSMTLVALTMASSQYGPRLLRNFITDRGNQLVLGTFISTFIYSLIVLLIIKESNDESFIPKISIIFAFLLSVLSLGVLIYFINHIASSIEAEQVIKTSFSDLQIAIDKFMENKANDPKKNDIEASKASLETAGYSKYTLPFQKSRYLQIIDNDGICQWAKKQDVILQLYKQPGDFCTIHEDAACLWYKESIPEKAGKNLNDLLIISSRRTPDQEIKFSIKQIVEVAVRALSPGINDPHTAITCIHWLGAALSIIGKKQFPSIIKNDDRGNLRLLLKPYDYGSIVDACFDHLRLYAQTNIYVSLEILTAIRKALPHAKHHELKEALQQKAKVVIDQLNLDDKPSKEQSLVNETYKSILAF